MTLKQESNTKKHVITIIKIGITVAITAKIFHLVLAKENANDLLSRLADIDIRWALAAIVAQFLAVLAGTARWQGLLQGQGVHASYRHLLGSFLIGRFFGAVTPGGIGLQGYMVYDIASRTSKVARATATVGVTMLAGWLGFGMVIIAGSIYGLRYIGRNGVILIDAAFLCLILIAILFLSRPRVFQAMARRFTGGVPTKLQSLVDAVCAYEGRGLLIARAVLLSFFVHLGHVGVYLCAARALGLGVGVGEVFFVTSVQILATLAPISINGMGVREAAAVGLYTLVGVPAGLAVLVPIVGFAAEMTVSMLGGPVLVFRRQGYLPQIQIDDPDREAQLIKLIEETKIELPRKWRGFVIGLGGGVIGGVLIGTVEAAVILFSSKAKIDYGVLWYGAIAYGLLGLLMGAAGGLTLTVIKRMIHSQATAEPKAYGRTVGVIFSSLAFVLGAFRIQRDVFHEELVWKSIQGLKILFIIGVVAAIIYLILSTIFRIISSKKAGRFLLTLIGSPVIAAIIILSFIGIDRFQSSREEQSASRSIPPASGVARNVIVIVVDTLRADHLTGYGYEEGLTPHLDAFANDAIRFDQHFANASWTRPSFASILTGRYASSHRVMSKADALPDEVVTLPEALQESGYYTSGFVTNFNVAPYFNFQQGFDEYHYLEPNFVLGANDIQQKLLISQMARRVVERLQPAQRGGAYQDASIVNRSVFAWFDQLSRQSPFFLFVGYMDPHDPYFEHPYRGSGYSRATHQHPNPEDANRLRDLYDGEITYWDRHFGALIAELKRRGLYDETLIVVTSDHGEEFMDHGGFWHGTTLYDEQVHIPLFVKLPYAARGGEVVLHSTESIDLMPTILREMGVDEVRGVQGRHLDDDHGSIFAEESHEGNVLSSVRIRRGRSEIKLITANQGNPRGLATQELYRVDLDPHERVNLSSEERALHAVASEELTRMRQGASVGAVRQQSASPDGTNAEALRSLGYAGGDQERPSPPQDASTD